MSTHERDRNLEICWVEAPSSAIKDGEELFFPHTALYLVDQTYDTPYITQQLHTHNWEGFRFIPNVWTGKERENPLGPSDITPVVEDKPEALMWSAWNHMLRQAQDWREAGERGELCFSDNFHADDGAHNCRKASKYLLESIGVKVPPELAASNAGMEGDALPLSRIFSLNAPPLLSLPELYQENQRLVDSLIPPWKMNKIPDFPGWDGA